MISICSTLQRPRLQFRSAHAGETLASGNSADRDLYNAAALGTRRNSHELSLDKHPLSTSLVHTQRQILLRAVLCMYQQRDSSSLWFSRWVTRSLQ